MFNSLFKIIYFIQLILITAVRSLGTAKYKREKTEVDRSSTLDTILLALNGVGMLVPIFYVFSTWLDFADYSLPAWLSWIGVALFALAAILLHLTHQAMGRSWTPTLGLREEHQLVTGGIFKYIRHPMYAAHILWAVAQPLILTNWIAGFSFLLPQILQYWTRVKAEEGMMLEGFGDQYREYMERTGRILPRIKRKIAMAVSLRKWIVNHQLAAFFILTYLITWPGFILAFYVFPGNQIVEVLISWVVFGPALAAIYVSWISDPEPKSDPDKKRWITFFVVWALASLVQLLYFNLLYQVDLIPPIIIICGLLALFPAWVSSSAFARNPGIRSTFSTLAKPRGSWFWYLVIFLIFPGLPLVSVFITRWMGTRTALFQANLGLWGMVAYFALEFSRGFLMTGGINEESGWRGFALPRLQNRYSVLVSALIVWFFWAAWHLPYDFGRGDELRWILENRLVWNLVISIIITWLYNRTNGSLLAAALFHPAMNAFGNMITNTPVSRILLAVLALIVIVADKMWEKLPEDHPAVYLPKLSDKLLAHE